MLDSKLESSIFSQKSALDKLENSIESQKKEITLILTNKIDNNATNINQLLEENRIFKRENVSLDITLLCLQLMT